MGDGLGFFVRCGWLMAHCGRKGQSVTPTSAFLSVVPCKALSSQNVLLCLRACGSLSTVSRGTRSPSRTDEIL